jgi:hypothetical protein
LSDPTPLAYETLQSGSTRYAITVVALQLLGLYALLQALSFIALLGGWIGGSRNAMGELNGQFIMAMLPLVLYLAIGVMLIRLAPSFARWLVRVAPGESTADTMKLPAAQELQAIAFSVAGIIIVADYLPSLLTAIIVSIPSMGDGIDKWIFVRPILNLAVGVALFLQSKGLAALWHKLRTGGITTRVDEAQPPPTAPLSGG